MLLILEKELPNNRKAYTTREVGEDLLPGGTLVVATVSGSVTWYVEREQSAGLADVVRLAVATGTHDWYRDDGQLLDWADGQLLPIAAIAVVWNTWTMEIERRLNAGESISGLMGKWPEWWPRTVQARRAKGKQTTLVPLDGTDMLLWADGGWSMN